MGKTWRRSMATAARWAALLALLASCSASANLVDLGKSSKMPDLGEALGEEEGMTHLSDQVSAMNSEVASLEKENGVTSDDERGAPADDTLDVAPVRRSDGSSGLKRHQIVRREAKNTAGAKKQKVIARNGDVAEPHTQLRDSNTAEADPAQAEAEAKMRKQIEAEQLKKARDENAAIAAKVAATARDAELKAQAAVALAKTTVKGAPEPVPDAPAPIKPVSPKVAAAQAAPMAPLAMLKVVPDGTYTMTDGSKQVQAARDEASKLRDAQITANGGRVPHVLPATVAGTPPDGTKVMTTDGFVDKYEAPTPTLTTGYCRAYQAAASPSKPKWTASYCLPSKGNFEENMKNIDGVICACGGVKVSTVPAGSSNPGVEEVVYTRAQVDQTRIRSYSYRLSANVDEKVPRPELGLTWEVRLTEPAAARNEFEVDPKKVETVFITFNRLLEFKDRSKSGLRSAMTKQLNTYTGEMWEGLQCDNGTDRSAKYPEKNCVLQDFFLDKFTLAKTTVRGHDVKYSFTSDIQGTAPWCRKADPKCAVPPTKKPVVTFDVASHQGSFNGATMNVTVENFPYKFANSSLAFAASIYAEHIPADEVNNSTGSDPKISLGSNVKLGWRTWAESLNVNGATANVGVVLSPPERVRSGAVSASGMRLIHKKTFFSLEHKMGAKITWSPNLELAAMRLPRVKAAAPRSSPGNGLLVAVVALCGVMYASGF